MPPGKHKPPPPDRFPRAPLAWLAVCLVVFAALPGMMSGNYLPKMFWATVTVAGGLLLIPPGRKKSLPLSLLGVVWLAYLGWALLSLIWAPRPGVGFERWLVMLVPTLAYLLAGRTRFWESQRFWFSFSGIAALVSTIGILQYYAPSFSPVNYFPGTAIPRGTMGHRNYAGMYLMVTLPFLAWSYFSTRKRKAFLHFAALLLSTVFLLLVKTRGAWVGLAAGIVFFFAAGGLRKISKRKARVILLAGPALATTVFVILVKPPAPVARALAGKADVVRTAQTLLDASTRLEMWRIIPGVTHPLLGAGFGNFPIVATPFSEEGGVKSLNWEVHNDYLQAYVDLGIPGAFLFTTVFFILIALAWKGRGRGLLLAAGASTVGLAVMQFTVFTMEVVSTQIWMAGVAAILNRGAGASLPSRVRIPARFVTIANYLAAAGLLVLATAIAFTIRGDREFRRAREEIDEILAYQEILRNPDRYPEETLNNLRRRLSFDRLRMGARLNRLSSRILPTMHFDANMRHINCHQFANLSLMLGNRDAAEVFALRALEFHPHDRSSLMLLAEIALHRRDFNRARDFLERGVMTFGYNPYLPFFAENLARLHRSHGEFHQAREVLERMEAHRVALPDKPYPANRSRDVPVDSRLEWEGCPAAISYELYLWEVGERKESPRPTAEGLTVSRFRPHGGLKPETTYIWRVRSVGRYGSAKSELWFFRTRAAVDTSSKFMF